MKLSRLLFSFIACMFFREIAYASAEEEFVCELRAEVVVADHLASVPSVKVQESTKKYVFIVKESKGTYINLSHPAIKGQLAVHSDRLKVTLVEQNTSDNVFIATIFRNAKGGLQEIIFSFHSTSKEIEQYYPRQFYGTCH